MHKTLTSGMQSLLGDYTRDTRLLQLTTPLRRSTLIAECVRGEDGIDQGFLLNISALCTDADIALKSLIGQPALLQLLTATSRDEMRCFHGYITGIEMSGANGGLARYQLKIEPWTAFLNYGRDSRSFQSLSVFDILDAVFTSWRGKGKLVPDWRFDIADRDIYPKRSLTTQYQESDFAFAERLMNEEGLFHYFVHTGDPGTPSLGMHTMVIADDNGSFKPNSQSNIDFTQSSAVMKRDGLDRWRTEFRRQADTVNIRSWDYRALSSRSVTAESKTSAADASLLTLQESLGPYAYETSKQGQRLADNMMQALTVRGELHIAAGTVRTLAPGTSFTLHGHARHDAAPDDDGRTFIVTRAVHLMHNNLSAEMKAEVDSRLPQGALAALIESEQSHSLHAVGNQKGERPLYRVRIDAIRASVPYRSSRFDAYGALRFPRPTVRGQQSAIVVGPSGSAIHTDRDHRIKVQFHWQRGTESHSRLMHPSSLGDSGAPADDNAGTWVRVATPMGPVAGANWGSIALPRVGQEVLVDFIEGDIDRPVVIGCLYNGKGAIDAQHNQASMGAGVATGNAPAWFPGEAGAHAHPAALSGFKSQAMDASQSGTGAYSQLVLDDSPGQSRIALQRHAAAHRGTDELNLGQLRHQADNQRLAPAGFGAELKSAHSTALRAAQGLLVSSNVQNGGNGTQLDSREAQAQIESSAQLQTSMASTAQKHNAMLKNGRQESEAELNNLPAIEEMDKSAAVISSMGGGVGGEATGGAGTAVAYSQPQLQLSGSAGIAATTPASVVICAGNTSSITAGHDINFAAQGSSLHAVASGIGLFTYGKASSKVKPNQEVGIKLHAASGKVSSQSQSGETRITADKGISVASVAKGVNVSAKKHVLMTAQGAFIKLEGGNIMIHGPGKMEFKATMKELTGPRSATGALELPPVGKLAKCPSMLDDAGNGGASAI